LSATFFRNGRSSKSGRDACAPGAEFLPAINQLPDAQARVLLNAYQAAVAVKQRKIWLGFAIAAGLYALSVHVADVRPGTFIANIDNFTSYLVRIQPTLTLDHLFGDIRSWYWNFGKWLLLLGDTLLVAYLGTLLGALGAFVLCFMASANLTRNWILRALVRRWLEFCRTVPDIVFAMIFLIAFKSGPMAGALALTVHTMGALGKLFAEAVENIDMKPLEGPRPPAPLGSRSFALQPYRKSCRSLPPTRFCVWRLTCAARASWALSGPAVSDRNSSLPSAASTTPTSAPCC
jgi:ABC-type phosphate/phosphonate transport system, permease component